MISFLCLREVNPNTAAHTPRDLIEDVLRPDFVERLWLTAVLFAFLLREDTFFRAGSHLLTFRIQSGKVYGRSNGV